VRSERALIRDVNTGTAGTFAEPKGYLPQNNCY
jgi:hypothetical protein